MADRALTDLELERWLAGALPEDRTRRATGADRARLDELRSEHAALLAGGDVAAEVAAIERRVARATPRRPWFAGWWWAAGGALAAAVALGIVVLPPHGPDDDDLVPRPSRIALPEVHSQGYAIGSGSVEAHPKGDAIGLIVHVADRSGSHRAASGDTLQPGDRLRFELSVARPGYVAVIGIDGGGAPTVYYPVGGWASAPIDPRGDGVLPGAIELDDAPGDEQFVAIYAEQPFALDLKLLAAARAAHPPTWISTATVQLHKKTSRF